MIRKTTILLGMLALTAMARAQYPPLSASEIAEVEEEVTAAIRTYYRLFNERNPRAMSERLFHIPWIYLDPDGARLFSTREDTAALFEDSLAQILPRGWERSDFPMPKVCVLSLGAATVSGNFYRYKKDRSLLSEHGVTYVFGKTAGGWRVTSLSSHPPGRAVVCKEVLD